ncbi:MAG TPA: hypothetical protein VFG30_05060 [Polyangiales bacterium]|jgi:hypothetical protein|nr:hypothetical protein [Polyangiales bacterium]
MGITAIALLRIEPPAGLAGQAGRVTRLDDGVLLHTQADFSNEPADLSRIVREQVGAALDSHTDPRGIFFIPSVATPTSRTYDAVIAEVGEGGEWGPVRVPELPLGAAVGGGALGALLGSLLEQMPSSVLESVGAAARGQPGAFEAATSQLRAAVSGSNDLSNLASQLTGGRSQAGLPPQLAGLASADLDPSNLDLSKLGAMLENSGIDMNAMQHLVSQVESALASDPERAAALAEKLFGASADEDEDDDK